MPQQGPILALDLACTLGWALTASPRPLKGTKSFPVAKATELSIMGVPYNTWLSDTITVHQPRLIVYEAPLRSDQTKDEDRAARAWAFVAWTQLIADLRGVRYKDVHASTWRRHFLGSAHGTRDELKRKCVAKCRSLGWSPRNDDEADALGVLRWAEHTYLSQHDHGPMFDAGKVPA